MGSAAGSRLTAARRAGVTVEQYAALVASSEKWCYRCRAWVSRSDFVRDRSRWDGLAARCRNHGRTAPGPSIPERREAAARGQSWCRRCEAWTTDVRAGLCREHIREYAREHYARNAVSQRSRKYARKRGVLTVGPDTREMLFEATGGLCGYGCGRRAMALDHFIPVARGGVTGPGLMVPACTICNSSKNASDPLLWVERLTEDALELLLPGLTYNGALLELYG